MRGVKTVIQPVKDNILLEKIQVENVSKSGIILSSESKDEKNIAAVIAIGNDVKEIVKGDKVIFESYKTTKIEYENKEYLLIKEENILGKII
ncbi:MAG: co-chaperone GroES [Erysipelotrichaceae bacterium]|nr:co-chaperone GroES [Erysipelotrichaceae bacterium]